MQSDFDITVEKFVTIQQLSLKDLELICFGLAGKIATEDQETARNLLERVLNQQREVVERINTAMQAAVDNFFNQFQE